MPRHLAALPALLACALPSNVLAQAAWTQLSPATAPVGRTGAAFASDGTGLLCTGGQDTTGTLADTWRFDGASWTQLATTGAHPAARYRHAAAYHLGLGRLVMFGGGLTNQGTSRQNDTWEFDGAAWTQKSPATTPSPRWWHSMTYDILNNKVLMFGGQDAAARLDETWHYDGTDWLQLAPSTVPPARERAAMATNIVTGEVLLFGGNPGGGVELGDTWSWNGSDWTQILTATTPYVTGTRNAGLTYDVARQRMVLFGGITAGVFQTNTWEFDGVDWTDRGASPMTPRTFPVIAYVLAAQKTFLFSGFGGAGIYYPGTWEYQTNQLGSFSVTGSGCGSAAGTPAINGTTPWAGESFDFVVTGLAPTALPILSFGFSTTTWAGGALPFNLGAFGAPTCDLLVSTDINTFLVNNGGTATYSWQIPNVPAAIGLMFSGQVLAGEFSSGTAIAVSARGDIVVGAL